MCRLWTVPVLLSFLCPALIRAAERIEVEMPNPKDKLPRGLVEEGKGPSYVWVAHEGFRPLKVPPRVGEDQTPQPSGAEPLKFLQMCGCAAVWQGAGTMYYLLAKGDEGTPEFTLLGWADARRVVISHEALKGATPIYRKGLIVNTVESVAQGQQLNDVPMLLAPEEKARASATFHLFNIYFIYCDSLPQKDKEGYYLLGTAPLFSRDRAFTDPEEPRRVIRGWVPKNRVCHWDTREAIEFDVASTLPEAGSNRRTIPGLVYYTRADAIKALPREGQPTAKVEFLFKEPFVGSVSKPLHHDSMRYPLVPTRGTADDVATPEGGQLQKVGFVGAFVDEQGNVIASTEELNALRRSLEQVKNEARRTEILFLVDDTSSMEKCFRATAKTIEKIIESVSKDPGREVWIGLCFYNDIPFPGAKVNPLEQPVNVQYARLRKVGSDKEGSEQARELIEVLRKHTTMESGDAREMVFNGFKKGIEAAKFSDYARKIVVLMGDCGDHDTDVDLPVERRLQTKEKELAKWLLPEERTPIELYAIQVIKPGPNDKDGLAFTGQMQAIIEETDKELVQLYGKNRNRKDLKDLKGGVFMQLPEEQDICDHILARYKVLQGQAAALGQKLADAQLGNWDGMEIGPVMEHLLREKSKADGLKIDIDKLRKTKGSQVFGYGYVWEKGPEGFRQTRLKLFVSKPELERGLIPMLAELEKATREAAEHRPSNESLARALVGTATGELNEEPKASSFETIKLKALGMKAQSPALKRAFGEIKFNKESMQELEKIFKKRHLLEDALADKKYVYDKKELKTSVGGTLTTWEKSTSWTSVNRAFYLLGDKSVVWLWIDYEEEWP